MKLRVDRKLEDNRVFGGDYASPRGVLYGAFLLPGPCGAMLVALSSGTPEGDEPAWEHVSVSTKHRIPNWIEMCYVKGLFWEDEELVVQFHPPRSEYINLHPHTLHLWRPLDNHIKLPPSILVGPKLEPVL